jgi:hypothetical protein
MKTKKNSILLIIILLTIILITIIFAPGISQQQRGSTYNKEPEGYSAWYEYMHKKGVNITRWQKPPEALIKNSNTPLTLLRILPNFTWYYLSPEDEELLKQGNKIIVLGVKEFATKAKFSTLQESEVGLIKIETTRRAKNKDKILGDDYGAIVWSEGVNKGELIKVTTPYLAANAYQDYPSNFDFLAQLVTQNNQKIFVDEYLHGYKDQQVIKDELEDKAYDLGDDVFTYLANTPLFIILLQGVVLLIVCLWGFNRRFGQIKKLSSPKINNTQAYVEALASVLEKAETNDFVLEIIGKEEQLHLQKQLGLGDRLLDEQTLLESWKNQAQDQKKLSTLLTLRTQNNNISELKLLDWLKTWQEILNNTKNNGS